MAVLSPSPPATLPGARRSWRSRLERRIRAIPIRWRILSITVLNTVVVLLLAALIWDGARMLTSAWTEVRQTRQSERVLVALDSETVRLQSLIHRYFNHPQPHLLAEIEARRSGLLDALKKRAEVEPAFAGSLSGLTASTERFLAGFDELRQVQTDISDIYEQEVLRTGRDMTGLFSTAAAAAPARDGPLAAPLDRAREAFSAVLMAVNAYYLSLDPNAMEEAYSQLAAVEEALPGLSALFGTEGERDMLAALAAGAETLRKGIDRLVESFARQATLLRDAIDGNQAAMVTAIDALTKDVRAREEQALARFDQALGNVYLQVGLVALAFLALILFVGMAIASSISRPLADLETAMDAIVSGDYDRRVRGLEARDEIGEMARAVDVFRENAVARQQAEDDLRTSKERAESALADLRDTQKSLIEAEKLAALGGLVAGVAHEVNNPVGISLTVASSLARRCDGFAEDIKNGPLRRVRLDEFIAGSREAAKQLVSNLERAGDLIQSFKQVAVDRSHEQRRLFDLQQSTGQIVASLRPGLKRAQIELATDIPDGIVLDSYPGAYGQVLTNLVLNAAHHAFADSRRGAITILARPAEGDGDPGVELTFSDDGAGMSEEVQRRAFDPFFTTRRSQGGTGLGLHIVYNIVTGRLGGRITLTSEPGQGTSFLIALPLCAPRPEPQAEDPLMTLADP